MLLNTAQALRLLKQWLNVAPAAEILQVANKQWVGPRGLNDRNDERTEKDVEPNEQLPKLNYP